MYKNGININTELQLTKKRNNSDDRKYRKVKPCENQTESYIIIIIDLLHRLQPEADVNNIAL